MSTDHGQAGAITASGRRLVIALVRLGRREQPPWPPTRMPICGKCSKSARVVVGDEAGIEQVTLQIEPSGFGDTKHVTI